VSHPAFAELVELWCGDAPDADALEDHVFACDACAAAYTRLGAACEALRAVIPPVISHAHRDRIAAAGARIRLTPVDAGVDAEAVFATDVDLLVHVLKNDLSRAERVDLTLIVGDGSRELAFEAIPFDARAGEVLIACQRHYRYTVPGDPRFVLTITEGGVPRRASYFVHHRFPDDPV